MKKNILVYTYNLDIGGIERSLIGLLSSIDYEKYNVDLYMFKHEGEFIKYIPKQVNIIKSEKITQYAGIPILDVFKKGQFKMGIGRLYAKVKVMLIKNILYKKVTGEYISQITYPLFCKKMNKINKEYDIALSFYWPHYFVKDNVKAKVKVGWIHTDYNQVHLNRKKELSMWSKLDYIAAVSDSCKQNFINMYPELKNKIIVVENILSTDFVKSEANSIDVSNEIKREDGTVNICSVGRFVEAKNFDNVPEIANEILRKGYSIKWYLIGYGGDEKLIRDKIKQIGVEEQVIILGKKENPYPYIKACDIYIQPSRYEGKAVTVREAQILNKPVIITNFKTAKSQLKDEIDGIIVPLDNSGCANGIISLIENKKLKEKLINNTKYRDYSNISNLNILYELLEKNESGGL